MNDAWYIEVNGQLYGPYLTQQLVQMAQSNQLNLQTLVKSAQNGGYYKVQDIILPPSAPVANQAPIVNMSPGAISAVPQMGMPVAQPTIQPTMPQVQIATPVQPSYSTQPPPQVVPMQGVAVTPVGAPQGQPPPLVKPVMVTPVGVTQSTESAIFFF